MKFDPKVVRLLLLLLQHHDRPVIIYSGFNNLAASVASKLNSYTALIFEIESRASFWQQLYVR